MGQEADEAAAKPRARLSPREHQVAVCHADGFTSVEVSRALGLSNETVRAYLRTVRIKYRNDGRDATNKIQMRWRLIEDGYLSD